MLAEGHTVSDDGLRYTVKLRRGGGERSLIGDLQSPGRGRGLDKQARLAGARQGLEGAKALLAHADFRGCASRCYYAVYQAMWAAVGEPEKKPRWEHLGLVKTFSRGRWFDPQTGFRGPGVFESQRFALLRLYDLRLKADYRLDEIGQEEAQWAVQTAQEIIAIAEQKDARNATQDEEV